MGLDKRSPRVLAQEKFEKARELLEAFGKDENADKIKEQHPDMKVEYYRTHREDHTEINNDPPVEMPLDARHEPAMIEMIKAYVRGAMSQQAREMGKEGFEEFNDFDVEDEDNDPITPFEATVMQDEVLTGFRDDVRKMEAAEKEAATRESRNVKTAESTEEVETGVKRAEKSGGKREAESKSRPGDSEDD